MATAEKGQSFLACLLCYCSTRSVLWD